MKKFFANRIVRQQANLSSKTKRNIEPVGKNTRIGIVFNATLPESRKEMENFKEKLQQLGAEVKILGFINEKIFPAGLIFKPGFDYFNKKELQWNGLIKPPVMQNFSNTALDYFIGAFTEPDPLLLQFAANSKAAFRVGAYFEGFTNCFDFMLDLKEKKELRHFCSLCEHYITQLKK